MVRATVLTYRWIDELQEAAYKTLGSIAGRAIGYLAPEVALGGAIVSAGLIETDALDRDGVAAYLNELAESNPELMDHVAGGRRAARRPADALAAHRRRAGRRQRRGRRPRRAARRRRASRSPADSASALRDAAAGFVEATEAAEADAARRRGHGAAALIEDLMANLAPADRRISVQRIGAGRYIAYLPGRRADERRPAAARGRRQRGVRPAGRARDRGRRRGRARTPG